MVANTASIQSRDWRPRPLISERKQAILSDFLAFLIRTRKMLGQCPK